MSNKDNLLIDEHKMQYHPGRVAQWLEAKTIEEKLNVFPIYVEISPVGHCNHRCTFCAVDYIGYHNRTLEMEVLQEAFNSMASSGVKSVMFAGEGEPLLHPKIGELIQYSKRVGIDVSITTNGTQMRPKFVEDCLADIAWIKVSCNAGTKETYAKVHRCKESDWDKVWNHITFAATHRDVHQLSTKIGVQMVVLPENVEEIEELAITAKLAGADYVVAKPYSQHLKSLTRKYEGTTYEDCMRVLEEIAEKISDASFQLIVRDRSMRALQENRQYHRCYSTPFMWAYIMATGDVYGCSAYLLDERFNYGNIGQRNFREIWTGEKRKKAIEFVEKQLNIEECRKNCRMDKVNSYLWDVKQGHEHANFI